MNFEKFIQVSQKEQWKLHGIQVFQNNRMIHQYGDCRTRYPIYSATKTITATAVGIAVEEGRFSIEKSLYEYLGKEIKEYVPMEQQEHFRNITIKRLLTMSVAGYPFRPEGENWLAFSLNYPLKQVEQPSFSYSNIQAYLVGVALEKAVGEHLISYLQPRFFEPLSIVSPVYQNCPSKHFYGASGMQLSVSELSRIGELYLGKGIYHGRRILAENWITKATSMHQKNQQDGYGYFIWKYRDGYRISGKWGQRCFVFPKQQLVVTYLCDMEYGSEAVTQGAEKYLFEV